MGTTPLPPEPEPKRNVEFWARKLAHRSGEDTPAAPDTDQEPAPGAEAGQEPDGEIKF